MGGQRLQALFSLVEFDDPSALVVLLEEELVVIDLQMAGWPTVPAPYLAPLHSSAITCSCHISNVPPKLWERVISSGQQQCPMQNYEVKIYIINVYVFNFLSEHITVSS